MRIQVSIKSEEVGAIFCFLGSTDMEQSFAFLFSMTFKMTKGCASSD